MLELISSTKALEIILRFRVLSKQIFETLRAKKNTISLYAMLHLYHLNNFYTVYWDLQMKWRVCFSSGNLNLRLEKKILEKHEYRKMKKPLWIFKNIGKYSSQKIIAKFCIKKNQPFFERQEILSGSMLWKKPKHQFKIYCSHYLHKKTLTFFCLFLYSRASKQKYMVIHENLATPQDPSIATFPMGFWMEPQTGTDAALGITARR